MTKTQTSKLKVMIVQMIATQRRSLHYAKALALILLLCLGGIPRCYGRRWRRQELKEAETADDVATISARNYTEAAKQRARCHLFVAPSTIPNAGLGIFTGIELEPDDTIGYADMVIPIETIASSIRNPVEDYAWSGRIYKGKMNVFAPGFLSLMNSHQALLNVGQVEPAVNVFPEETDATKYHYLQSQADEYIPEGGELFTFYGDHWFEGRERYKGRPLADDFPKAENLTKLFQKVAPTDAAWSEDLWNLVKNFPFNSGVISAFPSKYEYVEEVVTNGVKSLHQPFAIVDVDKLISGPNSRCLDMMRQGPSNVHNLGALATMSIPKGTVITGSPVVHTVKERLNVYGQVWDAASKDYVSSKGTRKEYSVMMNYCFGHVKSSILVCPYGITISYINHSSKPNVGIRWAPNGEISHADWALQTAPTHLATFPNTTMAIDYVALRDIEEGEEIFIDYGSAWDAAYRGHARQSLQAMASVEQYNRQPIVLTEAEQQSLPYPENLKLKCHPDILKPLIQYENYDLWKKLPSTPPYDCQVLERYQHPVYTKYTVYAMRITVKGEFENLGGITREYLRFFERQTDPVPFRHEMQLPDRMVPEIWKDL